MIKKQFIQGTGGLPKLEGTIEAIIRGTDGYMPDCGYLAFPKPVNINSIKATWSGGQGAISDGFYAYATNANGVTNTLFINQVMYSYTFSGLSNIIDIGVYTYGGAGGGSFDEITFELIDVQYVD